MRGGFRRRRPLLRAAVVGGGAYVAGKSAARRQDANAAQEADQDARLSNVEQQQAAAVPTQRPAEPSAKSPMMEQLDQLAGLHNQGVLTDEEFTAAKAKILGS
jgi:putative oligomerization/nucleic acid binding protein